ncbi:FAD-dependent oxidase [Apiospora rasikravindrae]|uniref:FAD-dependent oxidase n=1 Tax=Apiospora rasikravindrae TaxID=990691 RepID=A0ABR1S4K2_9PEZI
MVSSHFLALALAACLPASNALTIQERQSITQTFQTAMTPKTKIILASDPHYANETIQRWTVYEEPTYAAAIIPATASDVQNIVKIAGRLRIPFMATGGGHGLSITLHNLKNGISIDLSQFKKVSVDAKANTVTVGGGNVFGDVFDPVWGAGKEMDFVCFAYKMGVATGSCACPGVVGATIGGGVGRLQGLHGLLIDNLLSVQIVTADGRLLTASEKENSDLFWGVRGSGPNFGIVLSATYKIYDQTNGGMAVNADFIFPINQSHNHWETLKEVEKTMPPELALISGINYNEAYGGANILVNAVYYGPRDKGLALVEPFKRNNPIVTNITYVPTQQLVSVAAFGLFADAQCDKGRTVNTYTVGAKAVDVATWDAHTKNFTQLYKDFPQARKSNAFLETFPNQGVLRVDASATSFPQSHREITNYVLWGYNYDDSKIDKQINQFASDARSAFAASSGFDELEMYVTYAHGDEGPQAWYREKLQQLVQLKKKWDPKGLFSFMNPVPTKL